MGGMTYKTRHLDGHELLQSVRRLDTFDRLALLKALVEKHIVSASIRRG